MAGLPTPAEIARRLGPVRAEIDENAESYYVLKGGQLYLVYRLVVPKGLVVEVQQHEVSEYTVVQTEIAIP